MSETEPRVHLAVPPSGSGPGVLVLHAWWGLNDVFRDVCDRLADQGFVAVAPDLFGGRTADTVEGAEELLGTVDDERTRDDVTAAAAYVREHPAVVGDGFGVVGFSFGAAWALLLATEFLPTAVSAAVVFYGNHPGIEESDYAASRAAFLGHFAEGDEWEPDEEVRRTEERIRAAGREASFHFYPGVAHWFFERNRPEYDAEAAELAWERTLAFLGRRLPTGER